MQFAILITATILWAFDTVFEFHANIKIINWFKLVVKTAGFELFILILGVAGAKYRFARYESHRIQFVLDGFEAKDGD